MNGIIIRVQTYLTGQACDNVVATSNPFVAVWYSKKKLSGTSYLYQMIIGQAGKGNSLSLLSLIGVIRREWVIPSSTFTEAFQWQRVLSKKDSSMWLFWGNQQPLVAVWYSKKKLSGTSYLYQMVNGYWVGRKRWFIIIVWLNHIKFNLS